MNERNVENIIKLINILEDIMLNMKEEYGFSGRSSNEIKTYSKNLTDILNKKYGLPKGKKIGKLKIPNQILISRKLTIPLLSSITSVS